MRPNELHNVWLNLSVTKYFYVSLGTETLCIIGLVKALQPVAFVSYRSLFSITDRVTLLPQLKVERQLHKHVKNALLRHQDIYQVMVGICITKLVTVGLLQSNFAQFWLLTFKTPTDVSFLHFA